MDLDPRRRDEMLAAGAPYAHPPIRAAWRLLEASGLLAEQLRLAELVDAHLEVGRPSVLTDAGLDAPEVAWIGYPAWKAIGAALTDENAGRRPGLWTQMPEYEHAALVQLAAALTGAYPVDDLGLLIATAAEGPYNAEVVADAVLLISRSTRDLQIVRTGR